MLNCPHLIIISLLLPFAQGAGRKFGNNIQDNKQNRRKNHQIIQYNPPKRNVMNVESFNSFFQENAPANNYELIVKSGKELETYLKSCFHTKAPGLGMHNILSLKKVKAQTTDKNLPFRYYPQQEIKYIAKVRNEMMHNYDEKFNMNMFDKQVFIPKFKKAKAGLLKIIDLCEQE